MTDDNRNAADAVTGSVKAATDRLKATGNQVAETSQALNGRILDQAETNVREAFAALRAAAQAGSIAEVLKVQGDYVREQGARSMAQAREIGELIAGFGRNAMTASDRQDSAGGDSTPSG